MAVENNEVPILAAFKAQVHAEAAREIEQKVDRLGIYLPIGVRLFCLIAALGVYFKPVMAIFLIYPLIEMYLNRPVTHIHNHTTVNKVIEHTSEPLPVPEKLEVVDIEPDLERPNVYEDEPKENVADFN